LFIQAHEHPLITSIDMRHRQASQSQRRQKLLVLSQVFFHHLELVSLPLLLQLRPHLILLRHLPRPLPLLPQILLSLLILCLEELPTAPMLLPQEQIHLVKSHGEIFLRTLLKYANYGYFDHLRVFFLISAALAHPIPPPQEETPETGLRSFR
jgi:hypothetical protein